MKSKKAWMKIAEVFLCVLMIGALFAVSVVDKDGSNKDFTLHVEIIQSSLLNSIQINESLRSEIIELEDVPKESGEEGFPEKLNLTLSQINFNILKCKYKICAAGSDCSLNEEPIEKQIYARSVIISSTKQIFKPRTLNIFCWENEI